MKKRFSIGEMAKLFKINISTLRHYDDKGIFHPIYKDPESNYRYYDVSQFETLSVIQYLRASEMSIKEINSFLEARTPSHVSESIGDHLLSIRHKIEALKLIENQLNKVVTQLEDANTIEVPIIKEIPKRFINLQPLDEISNDLMDYQLRQMAESPSDVFTGRFGMILKHQDFLLNQYENKSLFLEVAKSTDSIPEGNYLVYRYKGGHSDAEKAYEVLHHVIKENAYEILGDFIEITLINDAYTHHRSDYVTEIQIQIARKK